MLCGTQYLDRHNHICKYIHWNILRDLNVEVSESWVSHVPKEVTTKDGINVLWDMYIRTDRKVLHNRPDIVIHNENTRECHIIDIAVPVCRNIVRKEAEKITKYRDLEIELQKCWNLRKVSTTPVVIGALGTVTKGIEKYIRKISPNISLDIIQKTALLKTARILRNFLNND